jgi:hypothetical protein
MPNFLIGIRLSMDRKNKLKKLIQYHKNILKNHRYQPGLAGADLRFMDLRGSIYAILIYRDAIFRFVIFEEPISPVPTLQALILATVKRKVQFLVTLIVLAWILLEVISMMSGY